MMVSVTNLLVLSSLVGMEPLEKLNGMPTLEQLHLLLQSAVVTPYSYRDGDILKWQPLRKV